MSGEWLPTDDGGLRLDTPAACRNGHMPALPGWGECPRCGTMTMMFSCADVRCDGKRASDSHDNTDCASLKEQRDQRFS